jgi:hypothetical protein
MTAVRREDFLAIREDAVVCAGVVGWWRRYYMGLASK